MEFEGVRKNKFIIGGVAAVLLLSGVVLSTYGETTGDQNQDNSKTETSDAVTAEAPVEIKHYNAANSFTGEPIVTVPTVTSTSKLTTTAKASSTSTSSDTSLTTSSKMLSKTSVKTSSKVSGKTSGKVSSKTSDKTSSKVSTTTKKVITNITSDVPTSATSVITTTTAPATYELYTQAPATMQMETTTIQPSYTENYQSYASSSWNGPVLTASAGIVAGPSGNETYYNLDMSGVISIMQNCGYNYTYWVRNDGVKMFGDYVMVAANFDIRPRGSLVPTSLGMGIVCDTGSFVSWDSTRLDIATTW